VTKNDPLAKPDAVRRTLEPIAVVGVSAIFPGSVDKTGFWNDILTGKDLIRDVPNTHWLKEDYYDPDPAAPDKTYAYRGAFLDPVPFDPLEWGVPPSIVPATDTTQLLALVVAKQVLEDATRGRWPNVDKERMSCILGVTSSQELLGTMVSRLQHPVWKNSLRGLGYAEDEVEAITKRMSEAYVPWQESTFPGLLGNVVAGRIANRLDLGGTNCVTDAACASSFSAISMGVNELWLGQSDLVICGGADTMNDIFMYMCFSKTPALSKSGECRPFSEKSDGTLLGEGLGMVALKRLSDAERDGDHIYAVLKGVGASSDGRSKSVYAPVPEGQAKALRRAYEQAGFPASTVELVEAHGTGTKAGDAAEFEGLRQAFDETGRKDRQWCAIGTVKSQIGHTKAAAGAAGLFKAVMALHHKVLPPTIKIENPNPKLEIEKSPFYLNTKSRPWIRGSDHPRRASVSSFGFGGSNFHLSLEEYTGPADHAPRLRTFPAELVVLSAATPAELAGKARALAERSTLPGFLKFAATSTQASADPALPARLSVVASDERELRQKLEQLAERIAKAPTEPFHLPTGSSYQAGEQPGKVAFLFPGQGSQYVGMGGDVAIHLDVARGAWDLAADLPMGGSSLHATVFPRPVFHADAEKRQEDDLRRTEWAQPAIGVASLALLEVMRAVGVAPDMVGGHSYGEITALHAAGVLSAADTLRIARRRGELMASASPVPGAMTAVPRTLEIVQPHVDAVPGCVIANHNAPEQVVVSGPTEAVATLEQRLLKAGIEAKRLQVATAFHSPLVAGSVEPFRAFLADVSFGASSIPVWHNPTAAPHGADVREAVAAAVAKPVRFVDQIRGMYAAGARTFVEVGPGSVLTNLVTEILGAQPHVAVALDRRKKNGVGQLLAGLGRLFVGGHPVAFSALSAGYAPESDPHDKPVPKMAIKLDGANYGKPYPPKNGARGLNKPNPSRTGFAASKGGGAERVVEKIIEKPVYVEKVVDRPVYVDRPVPAEPSGAPMSSQHPSPPPSVPADPWVMAFQEAQRATVEAHAAYQRSMAQSHEQFLKTLEVSFHGLARMVGGAGAPMPAPQYAAPAPVYAPPQPVFAPPATVYAAPAPVYAAPAPVQAPPAPVQAPPAPVYAPPAPVHVAAAPARPAPAAAVDVEKLLMEVVAEKTGYPAEMLGAHMALEADLGVDSIKRVEILSAVRERAPGLPEVDAGEMAKLQTLGQVVDHLRASLPTPAARPPSESPTFVAPARAAGGAVDVEKLLMEVVAEKTGYPAEMLGAHMALEADLGVDSIKRVEILSAVRERAPGLPEVDAGEMAKLQTLGQVVEHLRSTLPAGASAPTAPAPAAPAPSGVVNVEQLLMEVVAEKTGYPAEMLGRHMALEADLGVDSIKRVEILSAVRERAPGLPEVDAGEMAKLQTLGQVVDHLRSTLPAGAGVAHASVPAPVAIQSLSLPSPATAPPNPPGIGRWVLDVVPSPPTGLSQPGIGPKARVAVLPKGPLGDAVVRMLAAKGVPAATVDSPAPDSDAVVFLGTGDPAHAREAHEAAFVAARAVAPRFSREGGLFVTVQDTGGDFGVSGASPNAWAAGFQGLVKTVAQEWPAAHAKAIDVDVVGDEARAERIVAELLGGGDDLEVGLRRDGSRVVLRSVAASPVPGAAPFARDAVIVATGGARGVTAHTLLAMARAYGGRYVLLGRTAHETESPTTAGATTEPALKKALLVEAQQKGEKVTPADINRRVARVLANREVSKTLATFAGLGVTAKYLAVDVNDGARLSAALDEVRRTLGPIAGLVHGAGVLADKLVADKTVEQWRSVYDTKVRGLESLLAATKSDPLQLLVMFASVAGRCGNRGQADYAVANEVLAKVAAREAATRKGCVVKALQWGPWEGGMVTPELARQFHAMGVPLIPLDVGARMLVEEVADHTNRVEIVLGNEPVMGPLAGHAPGAEAAAPPRKSLRVRVGPETHAFLLDHTVASVPVVPIVLVMEWFARLATAARPDLLLAGLKDLKVLRGIKLDHFTEGEWFDVSARELTNGAGATLALELKRVGGPLHYTAQAVLVQHRTAPGRTAAPPETAAFVGEVYDGAVLFHGPAFHVLGGVDIGDGGVVASVTGTNDLPWPKEPWATDPAALDGGLQLALLWTRRVLGGASIPMGVGELRTHRAGPPSGVSRAILRGEKRGKDRTVTQVTFLDGAGQVWAELVGIEAVLRPS
jgi:acyl transferase domain-containing protein/NADP-dependent 3-hydroxy acid dehydrogenase YdfG